MNLDREYQRELLIDMAKSYPRAHDVRQKLREMEAGGEEELKYAANLFYLEQHGLADSGIKMSIDGCFSFGLPKITHRGLDFLADDGGLSAILGTVTVKLHEDTLKQLVAAKIEQSNLPPADKGRWLEMLRQLPVESTKLLAMKLMESGLAHAPDALQQVGKLLGFPV